MAATHFQRGLRPAQAVALVLLLALPFLQRVTRALPDVRLYGSETPPRRPSLSVTSWFDGSFARLSEPYFRHKIGFRGLLVRLANQATFSLFRRIPASGGTPITIGADDWLYETEYVRAYTARRNIRARDRRDFVRKLKTLQDALAARGIVFAFVISPSKPEIVPDHLPAAVRAKRTRTTQANVYEALAPALAEAGVRVFDAHAGFAALRRQGEPHLFARGGTHWTSYGAFLFTRQMLQALQRERPDRIAVPEIESLDWRSPRGADRDLASLLNLLTFGPMWDPLPYPVVRVQSLPVEQRLDVLMVGDSFAFTLVDALVHARAAHTIDLLYYHKRRYHYPAAEIDDYPLTHTDYAGAPLDPDTLDWRRLLLDKDLVLLETNEILLKSRGWGFVEAALAFLNADVGTERRQSVPRDR